MRRIVTSLLPIVALLLLASRAQAQPRQPMCCYVSINMPIDVFIQTYQTTSPFGFTIDTDPSPPLYAFLTEDVIYNWTTVCIGGAIVAGNTYLSGPPDQYNQVWMTVNKTSAITGQTLGTLSGFAVGPYYGTVGPPEWIEAINVGYACPSR